MQFSLQIPSSAPVSVARRRLFKATVDFLARKRQRSFERSFLRNGGFKKLFLGKYSLNAGFFRDKRAICIFWTFFYTKNRKNVYLHPPPRELSTIS